MFNPIASKFMVSSIVSVSLAIASAAASPIQILTKNSAAATGDVVLPKESIALSDARIRTQLVEVSSNQTLQIQKPIVIAFAPTKKVKYPVLASASSVRQLPPTPPEAINQLFEKYAGEFNLNADKLRAVAYCESHYHPDSDTGTYGGMFQFSASTWASTRNSMSLDPDPALRFNPEEAIRTAAFKISHGGIGAWPVCGQR